MQPATLLATSTSLVKMPLGRLVAGGVHAEHVGERTDLRALVVEGRRLDPGVLAVVVEVVVFRRGLAVEGMQRARSGRNTRTRNA